MKTPIKIFILIFFATAISCKKKANFHVKIINPATGEGYANTKFFVKSEKTGADGEIVKTEASGITNENGEALVTSLKISNAKSYYVIPESIPNICYINDVKIYYTDRLTNPNPQFTFEIAPCAYSKLTINNVNCEGPDDLMVLYQGNQIGTFDGSFGWQHHGCAFWQTNGQSDIPMGKVYYRWEVTRSSGTTIHYDTVYYAPGVLTEYEINY
jgi:hypothetical protein